MLYQPQHSRSQGSPIAHRLTREGVVGGVSVGQGQRTNAMEGFGSVSAPCYTAATPLRAAARHDVRHVAQTCLLFVRARGGRGGFKV